MGGGDWNDGMNRVGESGRGESVWLAFFLPRRCSRVRLRRRWRADAATTQFADAACRPQAPRCAEASRRTAGTASGTAAPTSTTARRSARRRTRPECQIDSIAAELVGAVRVPAIPARARQAQ
jgi:cyclic beta-1,2-glucan synthetase